MTKQRYIGITDSPGIYRIAGRYKKPFSSWEAYVQAGSPELEWITAKEAEKWATGRPINALEGWLDDVKCRVCGGSVVIAVDLGELYPSSFLADGETPGLKYPLTLVECQSCHLVQLSENPPLDEMYRTYWYRSGANPTMIADLADVTADIESRIKLQAGDVVIDIGCNDGTLFQTYKTKDLFTVGFDPALNLNPECTIYFPDYFPNWAPLDKKAKVITSVAVFYDLPDPNDFIMGIKQYLADDGIWMIQFTDLMSMLKVNAFDNICHEHLEVYSLQVITELMKKHGLKVFDVVYNKVNGGSVRVFVSFPGAYAVESSVQYYLDEECGILLPGWGKLFTDKIAALKRTTRTYIQSALADNKTVALLGASTKGNTLLQVFDLDHSFIDHAAEVNSDKFGLHTVGTDIPIISQEDSLALSPDIYLVLPWHFDLFFIKKQTFHEFMLAGGELYFPMPEPRVWGLHGSKDTISGKFLPWT